MEADYKSFYGAYLKEYHEVRAIYLNHQLSNIESLDEILVKHELGHEDVKIHLIFSGIKFILGRHYLLSHKKLVILDFGM